MEPKTDNLNWLQFLDDARKVTTYLLRYGSRAEMIDWGIDPNVAEVVIQVRDSYRR